jgi:hypothetical protein
MRFDMENDLDLRKILGTLADEERFRIIAAVSLGANNSEKIAVLTGLDTSVIIKALVKLEEAGLVSKKDKGYVFNFEVLQALNRDISKNIPKKPALTGLDRFFKNGKLITYPKDSADKRLVLEHIIGIFELGRAYTEKEVNETLKTFNPDYASYRRYLVDAGLFARQHTTKENGGAVIYYWRVEQL